MNFLLFLFRNSVVEKSRDCLEISQSFLASAIICQDILRLFLFFSHISKFIKTFQIHRKNLPNYHHHQVLLMSPHFVGKRQYCTCSRSSEYLAILEPLAQLHKYFTNIFMLFKLFCQIGKLCQL